MAALELMAWIGVFGSMLGAVLWTLSIFIREDSTEYDLTFVWDDKYTREDLNL